MADTGTQIFTLHTVFHISAKPSLTSLGTYSSHVRVHKYCTSSAFMTLPLFMQNEIQSILLYSWYHGVIAALHYPFYNENCLNSQHMARFNHSFNWEIILDQAKSENAREFLEAWHVDK